MMYNIIRYARILLRWLWLLMYKFYQTVRDVLSLLKPDKTLSSRMCFGMALLCTIIFLVHSVCVIIYSTVGVLSEMENRATNEIRMAQLICNQAEASEDSISVDQIFDLIHKGGLGEEFKISILDRQDTVLACNDKGWVGKRIFLNSSITVNINEEDKTKEWSWAKIFNLHDVDGNSYIYKADSIMGTDYQLLLSKPFESSFEGVFDQISKIGKVSFICLVLLVVCYLIILASLRQQTRKNTQVMGELDVAKNIQQQMLMKNFEAFPDEHGYDLHCELIPAKMMGGDLYDFVVKGDKLCFCVGDVSGKGMPAALFMSATTVLFRHVLNHTSDPADIASAINNSLTEGNDANMFCTMFIGVLDLNTNILSFCNAGHNQPVVMKSNKTATFLDTLPNMALGLFEDIPYKTEQLSFEPGISLYVYTDGVTEAENISKKQFSDGRLLDLLRMNTGQKPKDVNASILRAVRAHSVMTDQSDDITMLCIRYK